MIFFSLKIRAGGQQSVNKPSRDSDARGNFRTAGPELLLEGCKRHRAGRVGKQVACGTGKTSEAGEFRN